MNIFQLRFWLQCLLSLIFLSLGDLAAVAEDAELLEIEEKPTFQHLLLDNNSGDLGSSKQGIPEPMVFDLVRPLGAKKGQVEINTLGRVPLSRRDSSALWAPEIEAAIMDNVAVELELPFDNLELQDLKGAIQVTLPTHLKRYNHGL